MAKKHRARATLHMMRRVAAPNAMSMARRPRGGVNWGERVGAGSALAAVFAAMLMSFSSGANAEGGRAGVPPPEPRDYRTDDYRAPVPATLAGGRVIGAGEARDLWDAKTAIFIDVYPRPPKPEALPPNTIWRDPAHETIPGAAWLPNTGYGGLSSNAETYFKSRLARLSGGDISKRLVFFCQRNCWMSWNAAKRAIAWGYRGVVWFPDGTDGWLDLGESLAVAEPEK